MRWKNRIYPKVGDIKIVRKFLWFPVSIDGETRWLEYAYVAYRYRCYDNNCWWGADQFLTEDEWRVETNTHEETRYAD